MMRRRRHRNSFCLIICIVLVVILVLGIMLFRNTHFRYGTVIQGVDCSFLSVKDAQQVINEFIATQKIQFVFETGKQYEVDSQNFGLQLAGTKILKKIMQEQGKGEIKNHILENAFIFEEKTVKEYLENLPELQKENMLEPQNAYLAFGKDGLLEIIPEVYGNSIDFSEAYGLVTKSLQSGNLVIDFTPITGLEPAILATDPMLLEQKEKLNSYLMTSVQFILSDGSTFSLDRNVMKNWIYQDKEGKYQIDIEYNLPSFVEALEERVNQTNSTMIFNASDLGNMTINVKKKLRSTLDKNAQTEHIKSLLGTGKTYQEAPIYMNVSVLNQLNNGYVELDITRQKVWMYKEGECILETDCVTGMANTAYATPTGIYYLTYKQSPAHLSKYDAYVTYWMPFNGGIGFHDASWRYRNGQGYFGGDIYKTDGSHGCVNLPIEAAKTLYLNITKSIPIIVYAS